MQPFGSVMPFPIPLVAEKEVRNVHLNDPAKAGHPNTRRVKPNHGPAYTMSFQSVELNPTNNTACRLCTDQYSGLYSRFEVSEVLHRSTHHEMVSDAPWVNATEHLQSAGEYQIQIWPHQRLTLPNAPH